jgi:adenosylcobinamide-GDP ribazoletransferase
VNPLPRHFRSLHTAAAFLTVLVPATPPNKDPAMSMPAFPLVGLALGGLLCLPFALGLLDGRPWMQAWVFLTFGVLVTRGLHWDGWADLWDGLGSGATGERFWQVVKDSNTGAFGVLAMLLAAGGLLLCFQAMFEQEAWGALVFVIAFGRCAIPVLAWLARKQVRPLGENAGLGQTFLRQASLQGLAMSGLVLLFGLLLLPWQALLLAVTLGGVFLWLLAWIGRRHGGLNGDFFGAAVIAAELGAGLAFALAT